MPEVWSPAVAETRFGGPARRLDSHAVDASLHRAPTAKEIDMGVADTMRTKLEAALAPSRIEIVDESHRHAGHAGARPGGESHFRVLVVSAAFTGLNRVARHRLVNAALAAELAGPVHALALETYAPGEPAAGKL
jgi:BolA protein